MDVRVGSKLGQIGPQMGQICDFLRSVSIHFGSHVWDQSDPILGSKTPTVACKLVSTRPYVMNRLRGITLLSNTLLLKLDFFFLGNKQSGL